MYLTHLPDAKRTRTRCLIFHSGAAAIRILKQGIAATTADENGAINVWIDKYDHFRGETLRRFVIISKINTCNVAELRKWIVEQLKVIA